MKNIKSALLGVTLLFSLSHLALAGATSAPVDSVSSEVEPVSSDADPLSSEAAFPKDAPTEMGVPVGDVCNYYSLDTQPSVLLRTTKGACENKSSAEEKAGLQCQYYDQPMNGGGTATIYICTLNYPGGTCSCHITNPGPYQNAHCSCHNT